MLTVVSKLFKIINPDNAYFGEKDFQQLCIIKNWQNHNNIPVNIIASPTIREKNGLAMSSRNCLLSKSIRNEAGFIFKSLSWDIKNESDFISDHYYECSVFHPKNVFRKKQKAIVNNTLEEIHVTPDLT